MGSLSSLCSLLSLRTEESLHSVTVHHLATVLWFTSLAVTLLAPCCCFGGKGKKAKQDDEGGGGETTGGNQDDKKKVADGSRSHRNAAKAQVVEGKDYTQNTTLQPTEEVLHRRKRRREKSKGEGECGCV